MSTTITISNKVAHHLDALSFGRPNNANQKLRLLLEAEYRRRLARYNLNNRQFSRKYNMTFEEFERQQITKQQGYSWEVESDAMEWEQAVDGIRTVQRQLAGLSNERSIDDN